MARAGLPAVNSETLSQANVTPPKPPNQHAPEIGVTPQPCIRTDKPDCQEANAAHIRLLHCVTNWTHLRQMHAMIAGLARLLSVQYQEYGLILASKWCGIILLYSPSRAFCSNPRQSSGSDLT